MYPRIRGTQQPGPIHPVCQDDIGRGRWDLAVAFAQSRLKLHPQMWRIYHHEQYGSILVYLHLFVELIPLRLDLSRSFVLSLRITKTDTACQFFQITLHVIHTSIQSEPAVLWDRTAIAAANNIFYFTEDCSRCRQFLANVRLIFWTTGYDIREHFPQRLVVLSGCLPPVIVVQGLDAVDQSNGALQFHRLQVEGESILGLFGRLFRVL